jgi:maleate isomerase
MAIRSKRLGLIALATDHAIETELRRFLPARLLDICTTRVATTDRFDRATLAAQEGRLAAAARLLVPGSPLDVIAYGCTSGAIAIGERVVFAQLARARPEAPATTPITAAIAALAEQRAKRVALLTPYSDALHRMIARYLTRRGLHLVGDANLGIEHDSAITEVPKRRLRQALLALPWRKADAVFISCTSLRTADLIAPLEAEIGRPVITSNQAMAWHALRLAGQSSNLVGRGVLMQG